MRLLVTIAALTVTCLACAPTQGIVYREVGTPDGLHRVEFYGVQGAYAKRDAPMDRYQHVRFELGAISYREPPRIQPGHDVPDSSSGHTLALSAADKQLLERHFFDVFSREFAARSELSPVEAPGAETLTVRAHILDLVVEQSGRSRGAETRFSGRAPVFTLVLDVRDSVSGEPLARIVDRRSTVVRHGAPRRVDSTLDSAGLRHQLLRWARALRKHLDRLGRG